MVFTKREHINVFNYNHLVVIFFKNGIIKDICKQKWLIIG